MLDRLIKIPNLFWVPEVKVPSKNYWHDAGRKEAYDSFLFYLNEVQHQEATGVVNRTDIVNLILSAWTLKHQTSWMKGERPELVGPILKMRELAKKYGLTKIWDAGYFDTMLERADLKFSGDFGDSSKAQFCGKCGRAIWAPQSVQRGVGPVCFHRA